MIIAEARIANNTVALGNFYTIRKSGTTVYFSVFVLLPQAIHPLPPPNENLSVRDGRRGEGVVVETANDPAIVDEVELVPQNHRRRVVGNPLFVPPVASRPGQVPQLLAGAGIVGVEYPGANHYNVHSNVRYF